MQERSVTVAGHHHILAEPFFVLATQNPIEYEGTFPLPEAQLDRFFFHIQVDFPQHDELIEIADLVTEMELVKHPFRSGIKAQIGVEF